MRCAKCPLYRSWSNESDSGERCGIFGDGWDNRLQYEDASGNTVGCYVDHHFIKLVEREYEEYLQEEADSIEEWLLKTDVLWEPLREGESWLVSMPNDNPVNIYIRQGENNNAK